MTEDLLSALLRCRLVQIRTLPARPARSFITTVVSARGTEHHQHVHAAEPAQTSVRLVGEHWRSVSFRQRKGESVEGLLWRALAEVAKREVEGMPKRKPPSPDRKQRDAAVKQFKSGDLGRPQ